MGCEKYKVRQNGTTFGNFPAKNAEEAVIKAYNKMNEYYTFNFDNEFEVKRGNKIENIMVNIPTEGDK